MPVYAHKVYRRYIHNRTFAQLVSAAPLSPVRSFCTRAFGTGFTFSVHLGKGLHSGPTLVVIMEWRVGQVEARLMILERWLYERMDSRIG